MAILTKLSLLFLFCFNFLFTNNFALSQNKYFVFFADKQGSTFDPYNYFDNKSIERRNKSGITLFDITDFPINDDYLKTVKNIADSVSLESRWFNCITVYASEKEIDDIKLLDIVSSVEPSIVFTNMSILSSDYKTNLDSTDLNLLMKQTERMGGKYFRDKTIDGKGLRIAIFDGGFPGVDNIPAFEDIRNDGRIKKTWDFTKGKEFVYSYNSHGTMVMSCIGGKINSTNIGLATGAEFLLARTEINPEIYGEEENWLAAVEWADKNGADIINSSLGYTYNRYFPEQMNGKTTLASRAATMAAKKGILVVNAAGNDGSSGWHKIGAPADADSIISAGGIDPQKDYHIFFSSYGPTADKRLKPNVCAYGKVIAAGKNKLAKVQGTSFSSPLIAGFAACAWQTNRNLNNMQLLKKIEESGDLYPYFDYAHGYGVPQANYFTNNSMNAEVKPTFKFDKSDEVMKVIIREDLINIKMKNNTLLYYNIQDSKGILKKYYVIEVEKEEALSINLNNIKPGDKLNVHYLNYTSSVTF